MHVGRNMNNNYKYVYTNALLKLGLIYPRDNVMFANVKNWSLNARGKRESLEKHHILLTNYHIYIGSDTRCRVI